MNNLVRAVEIMIHLASFIFLSYTFIALILRVYTNYKYDKDLGIDTRGLRKMKGNSLYNRTESTPYLALRKLAKVYNVSKDSKMVDYGAGKGRVSIYLSKEMGIEVSGIEINEITYNEFNNNISNFKDDKDISVYPVFEYAEKYKLKSNDNIHFFFNPFHVDIFEDVLGNIISDSKENNKSVDIILYYPLKGFIELLENNGFDRKESFRFFGAISPSEKFLIYRLIS